MSDVTIYHNPRCSKSRQTLALLTERGLEPRVVEYLKQPPDADALRALVDRLGRPVKELVREREFRELGLPETDDEGELLQLIAQHPKILQRPIVVYGDRARVGRPPEQVLEILPELP